MKTLEYTVKVEVPNAVVDLDVYRTIRDSIFALGYKSAEIWPAPSVPGEDTQS